MAQFGDPRLPDRFWNKVMPVVETGCWVWTGSLFGGGYGQIHHKVERYTHRLAYASLVGDIPEGLDLDHLCRVRSCCNPDHLEPVTRRENLRRGMKGPRMTTHCPRGHAYSGDNLKFYDGHRVCAECRRIHARAAYHRRAARKVA